MRFFWPFRLKFYHAVVIAILVHVLLLWLMSTEVQQLRKASSAPPMESIHVQMGKKKAKDEVKKAEKVVAPPKPKPEEQVQEVKEEKPKPKPEQKKVAEAQKKPVEKVQIVKKAVKKEPEQGAVAEPIRKPEVPASMAATPTESQAINNVATKQKGEELGDVLQARQKAVRNYGETLHLWLKRHHRYPAEAERQGLEGVGKVGIWINADGRIVKYKLIESSGFQILDDAAYDTIKRANPAPPLPPELHYKLPFGFNTKISFKLADK